MNNLYEQSYKWNTVNTGFCHLEMFLDIYSTSIFTKRLRCLYLSPPSIKPLSVSYPEISKKGDEILPSTKILLIKRKWRTALLEVCLFKRTKISIRLPYEKNRLQCLSVYINEDHKSLSCLRCSFITSFCQVGVSKGWKK